MEQVTVEYNGEVLTLEVPDGATEADIMGFLGGEQQEAAQEPQGPRNRQSRTRRFSAYRGRTCGYR